MAMVFCNASQSVHQSFQDEKGIAQPVGLSIDYLRAVKIQATDAPLIHMAPLQEICTKPFMHSHNLLVTGLGA
jgi:hypothetical protein